MHAYGVSGGCAFVRCLCQVPKGKLSGVVRAGSARLAAVGQACDSDAHEGCICPAALRVSAGIASACNACSSGGN